MVPLRRGAGCWVLGAGCWVLGVSVCVIVCGRGCRCISTVMCFTAASTDTLTFDLIVWSLPSFFAGGQGSELYVFVIGWRQAGRVRRLFISINLLLVWTWLQMRRHRHVLDNCFDI